MSDEVIIRHRGIAGNPAEAQRLAVRSYLLPNGSVPLQIAMRSSVPQ
ncbi:MAG: hypothetical protein K2K97_07965 [Muribaculaceae bacterium]|nr:hypothetical protein [Muribaculaceae bacterium]